jgi:hypothetical protein
VGPRPDLQVIMICWKGESENIRIKAGLNKSTALKYCNEEELLQLSPSWFNDRVVFQIRFS